MSSMRRHYSYSRMEKEDPEEQKHRKARFLIYKTLEAADSPRRRRTCSGLRLCRMKIKIGRRLNRLRKRVQVTVATARVCMYRQVLRQIKLLRHVICGKEEEGGVASPLPPLFLG